MKINLNNKKLNNIQGGEYHYLRKGVRLILRTRDKVVGPGFLNYACSLSEIPSLNFLNSSRSERVQKIYLCINFLDVINSRRYQKINNLTFCNVYAHDFCHLLGVYIPRIWWSDQALSFILKGKMIDPYYGRNLFEQTCNKLYEWFNRYGRMFGWKEVGSYKILEDELLLSGTIGVVIGRNVDHERNGHISIAYISSSHDLGVKDEVLQTEAGEVNAISSSNKWWENFENWDIAFWKFDK